MWRTIALIAAMAGTATSGIHAAPSDNPWFKVEKRYRAFQGLCATGKMSQVERGDCLLKSLRKLDFELNNAVREKLFEIDEIRTNKKETGLLGGPEDSAKWKAAFERTQSSWATYRQGQCEDLKEFEWYGGNGGGNASLSCQIRLTLERLREITTP